MAALALPSVLQANKLSWGTADGQSGPAVLAACAARRWLARNAAGVKLVRNWTKAAAPACASLVSCLPALEDVELRLPAAGSGTGVPAGGAGVVPPPESAGPVLWGCSMIRGLMT